MDIIVNGCTVTLSDLDSIISYKKNLSQSVFNLEKELKEKREELNRVKLYLRHHCKHDWTVDSIDSLKGYKEGILIKYCDKCELNFKDLSF